MSLSEYLATLRQEIERLDTFGFAESVAFRDMTAGALKERLVERNKGTGYFLEGVGCRE